MGFIAEECSPEWDFITGNYQLSIMRDRYHYLKDLNEENPLKISLRDIETNKWTKWVNFPGLLVSRKFGYGKVQSAGLTTAIDVHRSMLPNEIIIESDYPTYDENVEAARVVGEILENKGFIPHYYYSGNKSVHIHIFLNFEVFVSISEDSHYTLTNEFGLTYNTFNTRFIEWLRAKMISCWDMKVKQFDTDLIKATHLIRAELSKNKIGYKTFLGYSFKDISFIAYVCNEVTRIYPVLGIKKISSPKNPQELINEFINDYRIGIRKKKDRKQQNLQMFLSSSGERVIRGCVGAILSNDFINIGDGAHRAMFILTNELKQVYELSIAKVIIYDWNERLGNPIKDADIEYRLKSKSYTLSCDYIHKFLNEIGLKDNYKCNGKLYK